MTHMDKLREVLKIRRAVGISIANIHEVIDNKHLLFDYEENVKLLNAITLLDKKESELDKMVTDLTHKIANSYSPLEKNA